MVVGLERRGDVAVLEIRNPPVNALGAPVRAALAARLDETLGDPGVRAIVLTAAGKLFSAGADIREFGKPYAPGVPILPELIGRMEQSPKPIVAALFGTVAGGAFELALGCHYRVGAPDVELALPEVTLGFVPGAGGTQRLPRLVGVEAALDVILTGRRVAVDEARALGLLDAVEAASELRERAVAFAALIAALPPRRIADRPAPMEPPGFFERACARVARDGRDGGATRAALECVKRSLTVPFEEGLREEREAFLATVRTPEARALRHVFFAEREAQKVAGVSGGAAARPVTSAGVVGFGTMGSGIAMAFANAGIPVRVLESDAAALERGLETVRKTYAASRTKGRLTEAEAAARLLLVRGTQDYASLAECDVVVEAVFEEMDLKRDILRRLEGVCRRDALLATNTSSLDVDEIAAATGSPERVLGIHFFSPAHVMRLVELVRPSSVAPSALATALQLVRRLGKIGVVVGVCDGFAANRMLFAFRRQADFLLEEGALPAQVDRALTAFGMSMGPYETADLVGLDVSWRIRKRQARTRPPGLRYSPIADRLCERGRLGQKTGAGWYHYAPGSRTPVPDPETEALIRSVSAKLGIARRDVTDDEIVERCFAPLVNEGARILEEGIAARASDLDVIWVHGYGFPRAKGGPMHWADGFGLGRIAETVERLHAEQGDLVRPSPLLLRLAREGGCFGDLPAGEVRGIQPALESGGSR